MTKLCQLYHSAKVSNKLSLLFKTSYIELRNLNIVMKTEMS